MVSSLPSYEVFVFLGEEMITINDSGIEKTFHINKMKATACESFAALAIRSLIKDEIKYPDSMLGGDIRQTIQNAIQNGRKEEGSSNDPEVAAQALRNIIGIARSAFANLSDFDRVTLLDKLLSTVIYVNGQLQFPLSYEACDSHITDFTTIYKLAWEVLKVNFPVLLAAKE